MPRELTTASRWAAITTLVLAVVLLERALHSDSTGLMVLDLVGLGAAVLGAVKMWVHNCLESHLVVITVAMATVVGTVLTLTVGMPGAPVASVAPVHVVLLALAASILVLLVVDARARRRA
ncbi:hypothetical protein [Knoellia sp. Soil729]|uniref:hypothetical protein n=1 Tax=Knoellia sp. Soil729 TaxID=1736394 RepID=UPI0006F561B9|nr:hypothetical protein [Knoellia sp. Soil729]KRE42971.1 hypothetical protein ASG74_11540 [Knoellia sp. Soil729]